MNGKPKPVLAYGWLLQHHFVPGYCAFVCTETERISIRIGGDGTVTNTRLRVNSLDEALESAGELTNNFELDSWRIAVEAQRLPGALNYPETGELNIATIMDELVGRFA